MPIRVRCPNPKCGKSLRVPDEAAGKHITCPGCGQSLPAPLPMEDAPAGRPGARPAAGPAALPHAPGSSGLWAAAAAILLLAASGVGIYLYLQNGDNPAPPPTQVVGGTSPGTQSIRMSSPLSPSIAATTAPPKPILPPPHTPLPEAIRTAWKKGGMEPIWIDVTPRGASSFSFYFTPHGDPGELPAFHCPWKPGVFDSLPAPEQWFGLFLHIQYDPSHPETVDAWLKELARFKTLYALSVVTQKITDAAAKELAGMTSLRWLNLMGAKITDAGVKDLVRLKELQYLNLGQTEVSDSGLKELAVLPNLRVLDLNLTNIGDAGVKEIAAFPELRALHLVKTKVTDEGLRELARLKKLELVVLYECPVTAEGLKELKAALPKCHVEHR